MVCYARPAGRLAILLVGVLLVFGRPLSHFLDTAAFLAVATAVTGTVAVAAALAFTAFASTRRRRAAGGGCVSCQFRCQHAMTEPSRRPWLVSTANRAETPRETPPPAWPNRAVPTGPVLLPMPLVRSAAPEAAASAPAAPRWPDRPLHRSVAPRERVGSPA